MSATAAFFVPPPSLAGDASADAHPSTAFTTSSEVKKRPSGPRSTLSCGLPRLVQRSLSPPSGVLPRIACHLPLM
eukprot:CAMPEP_0182941500 /NCGR_PEP_ID=MMETSP0105_2-20130417/49052_1 /TAXON_ID=81532 ORGANISM="Acanthoeca-like sp., Strain 10tr" /NCGR_SAMPLE_ID=MMETSP0105_2 /ASSEMBLY_ACC=CAM_ASM_000205 /LENGTH=74 /DNA_ID=CAMNT_0025081131 /DNA_START=52 /DNA_END=273 /DNA_ORIENTATION=+